MSSMFTAFLCLMHLCTSTPAMNATHDDIKTLQGRSRAEAREMMMAFSGYEYRWLKAHPWYTGEIPMSDVVNYPLQTGDHWSPPAGMRMAIGSEAVKSAAYVWLEPGTNFMNLGSSADSVYGALVDLYGHGLGTQKFRIGFAGMVGGQEELQEPWRGVNDSLPDGLSPAVSVGSVMIGGIPAACGTEPAAGDPALALPGTAAPASRCHRDAWAETEACNFSNYIYVPDGTGNWSPVKVYTKTELIQGWNINQVFTPTYAQLTDTTAYPAGTTMPPVPPAWASKTNPSTFSTTDCATNAGPPTGAVLNPPPTATVETSYASCPAGFTGTITNQRVHTHYWQVGANPADTYTDWARSSDTCVVAPGQAVNTSTGQVCTPGYWVQLTERDPGGDNFQVTTGWYWSGTGYPGNLWRGVPNTCPPTSPPPSNDCSQAGGPCTDYGAGNYVSLAGAGTSYDSIGGNGYTRGYTDTYNATTHSWGVTPTNGGVPASAAANDANQMNNIDGTGGSNGGYGSGSGDTGLNGMGGGIW